MRALFNPRPITPLPFAAMASSATALLADHPGGEVMPYLLDSGRAWATDGAPAKMLFMPERRHFANC